MILRSWICVVALAAGAWARASEPVLAERIAPLESTTDLEARQMIRCPSSYTSKNGLNFTTYCEKNNPNNDVMDPIQNISSMEECMERCSRYWGKSEGCFGVVWREDNFCWLRNSSVSTSTLADLQGIHSALVDRKQMQGQKTDCPFDNLSTQTLDNGLGYTVNCGKVIGSFDYCPEGYPACLQSPFIGFYHANSLQECVKICAEQHPLCKAAVYNPGLEIGYANCWPKTNFPNTLDTPGSSMGVLHTATITSIKTVDTKCPDGNKYTATGNRAFDVHCGQLNTGSNITSLHTQNITACMDSCASSTQQGCVGIVYDSTLANVYQNCYLQNTTNVIQNKASATYALLSGTSIPSGTGGADSNDSSSSSKAWIAGPVIGGIAAIAIIATVFFWYRRRQQKKMAPAGTSEKGIHDYSQAPAYSPGLYYPHAAEIGEAAPANEMAAGGDAGGGDGKWKQQSVNKEPQELGPGK